MIQVDGLSFDYPGTRALDGVSFALGARSITALVGPNGAGKTTLLRCLAALEEPYAGSIRVDGIDVLEAPREAHRRIGYLTDNFGLYADLTARQCLAYAARARLLPHDRIAHRVAEVAASLEIDDKLAQRAGQLSRGQRQRLAIAQAIIHAPRVLLLDEPASGLDPEARAALSRLMRQLQGEGMTLVVSSHILAELEEYCSAMLVLAHGRVIDHRELAPATAAPQRRVRVRLLDGATAACLAIVGAAPGATGEALADGRVDISFAGGDREQHDLLRRLVEGGVGICEFTAEQATLQDAYLAAVRGGAPATKPAGQ